MFPKILITSALIISATLVSVQADTAKQTTREFRPLMAKKVAVELAARAAHVADVDLVRSQAWTHFDSREWTQAIDKFLTVLEKDPASKSAAEGLAMSLYRSGDYESAYRLGAELVEVMPEIRDIVSQSVMADVRYMVKEGEIDTAREFLKNFPASDNYYTKAHAMVVDAGKIATALGSEGDTVPSPEARSVATN